MTLLILILTIATFLFLASILSIYVIFLRLANIRKARHWREMEAKWNREILEVLSGSHPPADLWRTIREGEALYFVDYLLRYTRRLQGRERQEVCELAHPFLGIVAGRIRGGDPERRARAVQTLSLLGMEKYAREVIMALDDESPLVVMVAAHALTRRGHPEYAEAVLERLNRLEAWNPEFLSSMLASVGSGISAALRGTLSDPGRASRVRVVSAEALRKLNDLSAGDLAVRILNEEEDREVLAASLRLLASVGRPEHLPPIRALCDAPDFVVRAHAVSALGRLGTREDLPRLRATLEDASPWVAFRAAWGLKEIGGVGILLELASSGHARADLARQVLAGSRP